MVYVNSKKFACESCIKGHRSSSCHHTDRPLFEIKKKGRPVSQCQKCRDLRQRKRIHSKCTCNHDEDILLQGELSRLPLGTKSKRFIPIVPALPNGLQDVLKTSQISSSLLPDERQRVETLLNPCPCRSLWKCKCRTRKSQLEQGRASNASAQAASNSGKELPVPPPGKILPRSSPKRQRYAKELSPPAPGPALAPILLDAGSSLTSDVPRPALPDFETMPPMSTMTSLAGSGCTCGVQCACPGCLEHRGPEHASKEHNNCTDGCGTCIDHTLGLELPTSSTTSSTSNILDRFFARAAALPAPPPNRKNRADLDPMDVTVYPNFIRGTDDRTLAFGLVTIPKLCCGGSCSCPGGTCGCGKSCNGCCDVHSDTSQKSADSPVVTVPVQQESSKRVPLRSCCAGKVAS